MCTGIGAKWFLKFGKDFILSLAMNENGGFSSSLPTLAVVFFNV